MYVDSPKLRWPRIWRRRIEFERGTEHLLHTRTMTKVNDALAAETADEAKLSQLKLTLEEKLATLKLLDGEVVELTEEDAIATEIERADDYKSEIYAALVRIDKGLKLTTPRYRPLVFLLVR